MAALTSPAQSAVKPAETVTTTPHPGAETTRSRWFSATPAFAFLAASLSAAFVYFHALPLWHTDLWGHLAYGRFLLESGTLPSAEPLMPLARGVRFVDTAWLSQLALYASYRTLGVSGLQLLFALGVCTCLALLMHAIFRRTSNVWLCLLGAGAFLWVGWSAITIVRPQLAGLVCFTALFSMLTARRWSRANWVLVPLLFVAWANLHGSFPVGLTLLAAFAVGRSVDLIRRTDKFSAIFHDVQARRYFLLLEIAAVAVLINPYGLGLYAEVLALSRNANLTDLVEWQPLTLRMYQGRWAAIVALALILLYRVSPRRIGVTEVLLLGGFAAAGMWTSRMLLWWTPLAGYYLALHAHAALRRIGKGQQSAWWFRPGWGWSAAAVAMVCVPWLSMTSSGQSTWRGAPADSRIGLSASTPVEAANYLRERQIRGQIFNTYEWGDYLLWQQIPEVGVFVASHAHLVPREVWQMYMQIINQSSGWEDLLDRYAVNTILIDKQRQAALLERLGQHPDWRKDYEDPVAVIFRRTKEI